MDPVEALNTVALTVTDVAAGVRLGPPGAWAAGAVAAVLATVAALVVGMPVAGGLAARARWRRIVALLVALVAVLVAAVAVGLVSGDDDPVVAVVLDGRRITADAVLAPAAVAMPVVLLVMAARTPRPIADLTRQARALGASRWVAWRRVALALSLRWLTTAAVAALVVAGALATAALAFPARSTEPGPDAAAGVALLLSTPLVVVCLVAARLLPRTADATGDSDG